MGLTSVLKLIDTVNRRITSRLETCPCMLFVLIHVEHVDRFCQL